MKNEEKEMQHKKIIKSTAFTTFERKLWKGTSTATWHYRLYSFNMKHFSKHDVKNEWKIITKVMEENLSQVGNALLLILDFCKWK